MLVMISDILTASIQNGFTDGKEYHVVFDLPVHLLKINAILQSDTLNINVIVDEVVKKQVKESRTFQ